MPYPWYQTLQNSNEVRQGDFVPNCPIIIPPNNLSIPEGGEGLELTVKTLNAVVVSQSCDLEHDKLEIVLVCPYYTLTEFFNQLPATERVGRPREKMLKSLQQGNLPSYHLLNRDVANGVADFLVVDFRNVYGVNYDFLKAFIQTVQSRPRLLPPYREHLSQAFARFFMRVGLPNDIQGLA